MFNIVFDSRDLLTAMPTDTRLGTFSGVNVDPIATVPTNYAPQAEDPLQHYSLPLEVLARTSLCLRPVAHETSPYAAARRRLQPGLRRPDDNPQSTSQLKDQSIPPRPETTQLSRLRQSRPR